MIVTPLCVAAMLNYCVLNDKKIVDIYNMSKSAKIAMLVDKYAKKQDLDPYLIAAIMKVESNFGQHMQSKSGKDHGPMQINEWWFKKLGIKKQDVMTFEGSIKWGTKILTINRDEYKGNGCWWSLYNSHDYHARRQYEVKVKQVFASLNMKSNCASVKAEIPQNIQLVSATKTSPLY